MDKRGRGWEGEEGEVMCIGGVGDGRVRKKSHFCKSVTDYKKRHTFKIAISS